MLISTTIRKSVSGILLFAGLLSFAASCKKDKDNNSPEPPTATQRIREFKTGDEFIRFDYNAPGI